MSRYQLGAPGDEEFESGSQGQVLRNLAGIIDPAEIGTVESALLAVAQDRSYLDIDTETIFSVPLIKQLHKSWLGSLYEFAGTVRTVDLTKGFVTFAPAAYLDQSLRNLDHILANNTPCSQMDLSQVTSAIVQVHVELVLVHPFREGNGRLSRWVADLMSLQAGFPPLEWEFDLQPNQRREEYFTALRRGFVMDFNPLESLVTKALERALRSAEDLPGE